MEWAGPSLCLACDKPIDNDELHYCSQHCRLIDWEGGGPPVIGAALDPTTTTSGTRSTTNSNASSLESVFPSSNTPVAVALTMHNVAMRHDKYQSLPTSPLHAASREHPLFDTRELPQAYDFDQHRPENTSHKSSRMELQGRLSHPFSPSCGGHPQFPGKLVITEGTAQTTPSAISDQDRRWLHEYDLLLSTSRPRRSVPS